MICSSMQLGLPVALALRCAKELALPTPLVAAAVAAVTLSAARQDTVGGGAVTVG